MMTDAEYRKAELRRWHASIPTRNDREALAEMRRNFDPSAVVAACDHITSGNYGYGAALDWLSTTPRMNRRAWLWTRAVAIEYGVTLSAAARQWHTLSVDDQRSINARLDQIIAESDASPVITV